MDPIRISGTEPLSWVLSQTMQFQKLDSDVPKVPKQVEAKRNGVIKQNRSTEGCSKFKRSVDMTSSGKNGLNIRTNASPKWDRTRCPEE